MIDRKSLRNIRAMYIVYDTHLLAAKATIVARLSKVLRVDKDLASKSGIKVVWGELERGVNHLLGMFRGVNPISPRVLTLLDSILGYLLTVIWSDGSTLTLHLTSDSRLQVCLPFPPSLSFFVTGLLYLKSILQDFEY